MSLRYGPIKVLLYLVSKYHLCELICGAFVGCGKQWCVCVNMLQHYMDNVLFLSCWEE